MHIEGIQKRGCRACGTQTKQRRLALKRSLAALSLFPGRERTKSRINIRRPTKVHPKGVPLACPGISTPGPETGMVYSSLTIRERIIACRCLAPRTSFAQIPSLLGCAMDKLTQLLDAIDSAYRIAATTDRDTASLLLLASLKISQRIESQSERRPRRAA